MMHARLLVHTIFPTAILPVVPAQPSWRPASPPARIGQMALRQGQRSPSSHRTHTNKLRAAAPWTWHLQRRRRAQHLQWWHPALQHPPRHVSHPSVPFILHNSHSSLFARIALLRRTKLSTNAGLWYISPAHTTRSCSGTKARRAR